MLTYLSLAQCSFFYLCFVWAVAKSSCQVMWFFIYFFLLSCLFHKLTCFLTERTATIAGAFRHECWSYSSASLLFMHLLVGLFKHPRKRWKTFFSLACGVFIICGDSLLSSEPSSLHFLLPNSTIVWYLWIDVTDLHDHLLSSTWGCNVSG